MTGKLLQVLGAAFVLLLVGSAIAGFMVLKDRVKVVVSSDEAAVGPDPTSLLRDDVQVLTRDFGALQQALGTNFEQLGNALEERAADRHGAVLALQQQVATLEQRLEASSRELQGLRQQLAGLPAMVAAAVPAAAPLAAGTGQRLESPPGAAPAPTEVVPVAMAEPPPPAAASGAVTPAAEPVTKPKPKGGFLSFSVPTATFRFDQLQEFTIVPELSRVGFDAKSTLHDFTGVTSQVKGSFRADFDDPQGAWSGQVVVQAPDLKTGVEGRDTNMLDYLDVKNHPELLFTVSSFQPAAGGIDVARQTARGEVKGTMRIRGKTREVSMPVTVEVDPQKRVVLTGQMPLLLSDYEVPVPSQLGLINMQDEVKVWIALRARLVAGGGK
ncbi:MAG: YceI family protein [Planctomycetes bacterium]|jgi:polyisoprenoid-binding protein YceI|nr:YceI family protein [Planctomycetota bacterium]